MSKTLSLLILILFCGITSAQDTVQSYNLIFQKECFILNKDGTPFTGLVLQERIFSQKAKSIFEVKDGTRNGFHKDYYRNGQLKNHGFYQGGSQEGVQYEYYKNGNPAVIYEKSLSTYHRKFLSFTKNGSLTSITNYHYGQQTGYTAYYGKKGTENHNLKIIGEKENSKIKISANSNLVYTGFYYNGKQDGTWKFYDKNGKCSSIYEYEKGEKTFEKFID